MVEVMTWIVHWFKRIKAKLAITPSRNIQGIHVTSNNTEELIKCIAGGAITYDPGRDQYLVDESIEYNDVEIKMITMSLAKDRARQLVIDDDTSEIII